MTNTDGPTVVLTESNGITGAEFDSVLDRTYKFINSTGWKYTAHALEKSGPYTARPVNMAVNYLIKYTMLQPPMEVM